MPFFEDALSLIDACLDSHDVLTGSPPLICLHNMKLKQPDVEVGYRTAPKTPSEERISRQSHEPCKAVSAIDMGSMNSKSLR